MTWRAVTILGLVSSLAACLPSGDGDDDDDDDVVVADGGADSSPAGACTTNDECDIGLVCGGGGECILPVVQGGACSLDRECATGLICRLDTCLPPGGEGESCEAPDDCLTGLDCLYGACHGIGGPGEACDLYGGCDSPDLICYEGTCRTTISARFCHCLTNSFGDTYYFSLIIGGVSFPPIPTATCTACTLIPTGELAVSLDNPYDSADPWDGSLAVDPAWPDVAIFATPSHGLSVYESGCQTTAYCP